MSPTWLICLVSALVIAKCEGGALNLSCYQCVRFTNEECAPQELVTCAPQFDRCVTHIEKDDRRGYVIKRECGLGPCAFEDDMANKGLGMNACDRSKSEYFCVSCCRTSGCNKSAASSLKATTAVFLLLMISLSHVIKLFHN